MVNYARMESVWRSYGPLEPIGPAAYRPRRRRNRAVAAGIAAVCTAGAAAGLYLRPDLGAQARPTREAPVAERGTVVEVSDAPPQTALRTAPPGVGQAAAQLQHQLQLLMMDAPGARSPEAETTLPAAPVVAAPPPPVVVRQQAQAAPAARAAPARPLDRAAAPATRQVQRPAARPTPAPMVLASRTPPPVVYPRAKSRPAPAVAPLPAPEPVAAEAPARVEPQGPSYDCDRARTAAERMICGSPELAALDRNMAAELEAAVAAGHSAQELARDQASWRRRREKAAPDPRAVADIYRQRIGQLRSMQ